MDNFDREYMDNLEERTRKKIERERAEVCDYNHREDKEALGTEANSSLEGRMYKIAIQYCPQDKQESVKLSAVKCEGERVLGVDGFVFQFFTGEDTDQFLIDLEKLGNDIDYILWV